MPPKRKNKKGAHKQPAPQKTKPTPETSKNDSLKSENLKNVSPEPQASEKEPTTTEAPEMKIDGPDTTKNDTPETKDTREESSKPHSSKNDEPKLESPEKDTQRPNSSKQYSQKSENVKNFSPEPQISKQETTESAPPKKNIDEPDKTKHDTLEANATKKDSHEPEAPKKNKPKQDTLEKETHKPHSPKKNNPKSEIFKEVTPEHNTPEADVTKPDTLKNDKPSPATPEELESSESGISAKKDESKSKSVTESPDNVEEAIKEKELGNAAYKKRDFDAALRHYDKAFELNPNNIAFLTNKSAVYFEMGDYANCLRTCELAESTGHELNSDSKFIARALGRMGHCYEKQSDFEMAKKFYDKSLSEFRAPDIIKKAQALEKHMKEAEQKAYINLELAEQEKLKGDKEFSDGNFPEALKFYTEAVKRNPDDARLYSYRAACYFKLMEFACALKDCETCVTLDPTIIDGYLQTAKCCIAMKNVNSASFAYLKALELDPNCQEAQDGLKQCDTAESVKEADRQPGQETGVTESAPQEAGGHLEADETHRSVHD